MGGCESERGGIEVNAIRPLVTVGVPAYNRPEGLARALDSILTQTYQNLEVIISDDCSPNSEVAVVGREFENKDKRVKFTRQPRNIGMPANFQFVLEQSSADYFMWVADDDRYSPEFIEKCMVEMLSESQPAAVGMEINYTNGNKIYDFFKLGFPFYQIKNCSTEERIIHMLNNYHGDMIYSLYRRSALYKGNVPCTRLIPVTPIESPLFVFVSSKGPWKILDGVGLYKNIDDKRYRRIRWFIEGGGLPDSRGRRRWSFSHFKRIPVYVRHNMIEMRGVFKAINAIDVSLSAKLYLRAHVVRYIFGYLLQHAMQYKSGRHRSITNFAI